MLSFYSNSFKLFILKFEMDLKKLPKEIKKYNFSTVPCRLLKDKRYTLKFIKSQERFYLMDIEEREKEVDNLLRRKKGAYLITQLHLEICEDCYNYYTKIATREIGYDKWNKIFGLEKAITLKILEKLNET